MRQIKNIIKCEKNLKKADEQKLSLVFKHSGDRMYSEIKTKQTHGSVEIYVPLGMRRRELNTILDDIKKWIEDKPDLLFKKYYQTAIKKDGYPICFWSDVFERE